MRSAEPTSIEREPLDCAVLFLVFNRPDTTARVFDAIRAARPRRLYVACDGPRPERVGEEDIVEHVRGLATGVDWCCDLRTLFRDENLGCAVAVSAALTWFFEQESCGIILEDDCLPCHDFFRFCAESLKQYEDDSRVLHINGNNFDAKEFAVSPYSYHFVRFPQVWGWASWRRAWRLYDFEIRNWPRLRDGNWMTAMPWAGARSQLQRNKFNSMIPPRQVDTWDYQWHLAVWSNSGLAIAPKVNLVSNLGFGSDATHTLNFDSKRGGLPTGVMRFPLAHPEFMLVDPLLDEHYASMMISSSNSSRDGVIRRLKRRLRRTIR